MRTVVITVRMAASMRRYDLASIRIARKARTARPISLVYQLVEVPQPLPVVAGCARPRVRTADASVPLLALGRVRGVSGLRQRITQ